MSQETNPDVGRIRSKNPEKWSRNNRKKARNKVQLVQIIIFDSYNFDLSNEMFLIIGCLYSIFTNISGIYLTKCISPKKFDKF